MTRPRAMTLLQGALILGGLVFAAVSPPALAEPVDIPLKNPSFEDGADDNGIPLGWVRYGGAGDVKVSLLDGGTDGDKALLIHDADPTKEIGVSQDIPARPDTTYRLTLMARTLEDQSTSGSYIQMRFLPSNKYAQVSISVKPTEEFQEVIAYATAPPDTKALRIYLYAHADPMPKVVIDNVKLVSGVEPPPPPPPPAPPAPKPVPPVHDKLKDLHLQTDLVKAGQPTITIVAPASASYDQAAAAIQQAIEKSTGVKIPVVTDETPQAAVPIQGNLIVLGNRSTNKTISGLYDLFYTLLDLKYPGRGGHVVRTLHSPFGDGRNVIFVGGSDTTGVAAAAEVLITRLSEAGASKGRAALGCLADIKLGEGVTVPAELKDVKIWEESVMYGSGGYFGWNTISKRMALYYMTGDQFHAREFLRLAFPDEKALAEIDEADGERIENKNDPLAGPYHYSAHMMLLFWDLIEESPVFSDEDRLRVTNAFSRQLTHRAKEGIYGLTKHRGSVGHRHGDWAAMSLYVIARYFHKDYPDPIWQTALDSVSHYFSAIEDSPWMAGYNDHIFWHTSYYDPILDYIIMTDYRAALDCGNLEHALRTQDVLFTGNTPDWGVKASSLNYLDRMAYLTGDGKWLFYRDRTGIDTTVFRLGQSYWPDDSLQPRPPTELLNKWTIQDMPEPMWKARNSGLPLDNSFLWGSFRSSLDGSGDYVLIKGHNGAGRNPYHTFVALELRLSGHTLLKGYHTQVLTNADGMVEPQVAMNAALLHHDTIGNTVLAVAEVPKQAYCNWRRTLAQRVGRYALFVDDLTFRTDSANMEVNTEWNPVGGAWKPEQNALRINGKSESKLPAGWLQFRALEAPCTSRPAGEKFLRPLNSLGIYLLLGDEPGGWIQMPFTLEKDLSAELFVDLLNYTDRGNLRIYLDDEQVVETFEHYAPAVEEKRVSLGKRKLTAGEHSIRVEAIERPAASARCNIALKGITITPDDASAGAHEPLFQLLPSDPLQTKGGSFTTMTWRGAVKDGQHLTSFYLLGQTTDADNQSLSCLRIADNAAVLALPAPALAAVGQYQGLDGELVILAADHLFGRAVWSVALDAPLLAADKPIDLDWDFAAGDLHIVTTEDTQVGLALAAAAGVKIDGKPASLPVGADGLATLKLPPGRHHIEAVAPPGAALKQLAAALGGLLDTGRRLRAETPAPGADGPLPTVPELAPAMTAEVAGRPVAMAIIPSAKRPLICVAEGQTVHLLTTEGEEVHTMQTDGPVRVLRWWGRQNLLLVGCEDEQVIAFDLNGNRRWVFTSVMDPAVYEAGKQYWFKSARGHEGVHALHTGVFLEGQEQCFVGSACTLEVIDGDGKLVKRLPVFWGPGTDFDLIDAPDGSINLLVSRWHNGNNARAIVNNKTFSVGRGFYTVPTGHTFVGGWDAQNRVDDLYTDLDGDGNKEVVAAINGSWNRVTVWSGSGNPLYNAQFGPAASRAPRANIRAIDIADLDGDGTREILVGIWKGLVVALDHQCNKLWARRTPTAPTVIKCLAPDEDTNPSIFVGCDDGTVVVLDGGGEITRLGHVTGRPWHIDAVDGPGGPLVVIATDKGSVQTFKP